MEPEMWTAGFSLRNSWRSMKAAA